MTLETWADKTRQAIQDEQSAKLRTELEQLRGECAALRKALEHIVSLNNHYSHSDLCETAHPDVQSARYDNWTEEQIEADMLDNCCCPVRQVYFAKKALASSPLSEKYAAVVSAALRVRRNQIEGQRFCTTATYGGNQEEWKRLADEELEGVLAWENAIDALQEATK